MDRRIFVFAALLLFFGAASAATLSGDFSLSMSCEKGENTVYTLYNDSSAARTYTVRALGENSGWVNINGKWVGSDPLTVTVSGRSSVDLYALVKPQTCYVRPGSYQVRLAIEGNETTYRDIEVEVVESRILGLEVVPKSQGASQCEESFFEIRVRNEGEWEEQVSLEVEGLPSSWTNLENALLSISGGQARETKLSVKPPCSADAKEYPFTVKANLLGTDFSVERNAVLEIDDRQDISITAGKMVACSDKASSETISIGNEGLQDDVLELSVEGQDWASVEPGQVAIGAGDEEEAKILFSKTSAEKGSYEFTVKAFSEKFGKTTSRKFSVDLQDCYKVSVNAVRLDDSEIGEMPAACIESSPKYVFSVKNESVEAVNAEIRVTGLDATVSPSSMKIGEGETKVVSVELDFGMESPGQKSFEFEASGQDFSARQKLGLEAVDCYSLEVDWDGLNDRVELDQDCRTQVFTATIKNTGEKGQDATISLTGPEWVYAEPKALSLEAGEEQEAYFYIAPPFNLEAGSYSATASVLGRERAFSRKVEIATFLYGEEQKPEDQNTEEKPKASVEAEATAEIGEENTATVKVKITNNGTEALEISGVSTEDLNVAFELEATTIEPGESLEIEATAFLGEAGLPENAVLKLETMQGTLEAPVKVSESTEGETAGLFGLAGVDDLLLAAIVIIVIVVFAAIALRSESGPGAESGLKHLVDEVQELPGKKLEQIGKRKRLGSIAREVKKPARKRASRKTSRKRPKAKKK